jgi:hypothetical protein
MRRMLLAAAVIGGLAALASSGASAAPTGAGLHVAPSAPLITDVQYWYRHHHWHHRHWYHGGWRYWD